jgi:lipid-A-disaccharide synthase
MRIFFSAGEPSGDLHGANLIRELRRQRPDLEAVGYGGPEMAAAGCRLHADLTKLAVMWLLRALLNLHRFLSLLSQADRYFRHHRPQAVVLVDFPGFNWWIARRAKAHGIPVFYYAPPQIWAWASWRVKKMRRFVDHVLCSLPFEQTWFAERGCRATFVGHPYFDEVRRQQLDQAFLARQRDQAGPLVTLLPGSRTQEVTANLKHLLRAAALIRARVPQARFAVAAFKLHQAHLARELVDRSGLPAEVFVRRTPELIQLAECCLAVSGSVSLELLYQAKPTAILYWIGPLAYWLQGRFRRVKYITLVNLLAAREIFPPVVRPYDPQHPDSAEVLFPEYLTCEDKSAALAGHVIGWLERPAERQALVARLMALRAEVAHGGASRSAAACILADLGPPPQRVTRPHAAAPAPAAPHAA